MMAMFRLFRLVIVFASLFVAFSSNISHEHSLSKFSVEDITPHLLINPRKAVSDTNSFLKRLEKSRYNNSGGCGHWQEKYMTLHKEILAGIRPRRYLISIAPPQGLADRLSGLVTHFIFALLTNRAFLHTAPPGVPPMHMAFELRNIESEMPSDFMFDEKVLMNLTFMGYPPSIDKNKIYGLYLNAGPIVEQYSTVVTRNKKLFIYRDLAKQPEGYAHTEELYVTGNRGLSWKLFQNPFHKNQLINWGLRKETAFKCVFDFLFQLKPSACSGHCEKLHHQIIEDRNNGTILIGVQVRVGDSVFSKDLELTHDAINPIKAHFLCAAALSQQFEMAGRTTRYFFISDSLALRKLVKSILGDKVLVSVFPLTLISPKAVSFVMMSS